MSDASGPTGTRYRAFISYSHRDAAFAARLHRRLEGYVLPKRLNAGRRLTPIFKDREELPAAHDLSAQVRAALAASDCLIVVCSPDAAASPWVAKEIETFRALQPSRPILAALIRGEPAKAFPPALSDGGVEPLAADFRKEADGERLALLKLAAGMAGVGVDQLVQRDAQRRLRGVMAVTVAAFVGMLAMGGMTTFALTAQAEAERQRREAEGMVEFMLTDLRDKLEEVGSLKVLTEANRRALDYYERHDPDTLPPASRLLYARLLQTKAEDLISQAELNSATTMLRKAYHITDEILRNAPNEFEPTWAHSQSVYWLGYIQYQRRSYEATRHYWSQYLRLAQRLVNLEPGNPRAIRELAFAEGNLCTLAIEWKKSAKEALRSCLSSLKWAEIAADREPSKADATINVANRHGWMADALELAGDFEAARKQRTRQEDIVTNVLRSDPSNQKARDNWVGSQRALARIAFRQGNNAEALLRIDIVRRHLIEMTNRDPSNNLWRRYLENANEAKAYFETHTKKGHQR
ncbi:MAG TPA: toll/interleukin-1 receptor domain-containing protein [Caulobacter sp.]|nr:toll/interleukin-1 receptor domain-containing protein [Caulobacter sp.]